MLFRKKKEDDAKQAGSPNEANDFIYAVCRSYCEIHAPNELMFLDLNRSDLSRLLKRDTDKLTDTLGSGIEGDLVVPYLVSLLANVTTPMVNGGWVFTAETLKASLSKMKEALKNISSAESIVASADEKIDPEREKQVVENLFNIDIAKIEIHFHVHSNTPESS
jgi:hypothetical protein